jgi:molybdopterin/thiamine biosynthesis adenylyltransferase
MLTAEEARRYSRQMALPEIGVEGQLRLAAASREVSEAHRS